MFRFLISALLVVFLIVPTSAQSITPQDQTAFQAIIAAQLDAFKKDDGAAAYSYAAPVVQGLFPDAEKFMTMVKHGYEPIFKNTKHSFGQVVDDGLGHPNQHVIITTSDGKRYEAVYVMQQQPDGSWKIAGVQMVEIPTTDA